MPTKSRVKEQLEKGWNNDLKVRQTVGLVGNKHIFSPDDNVKPFVESKSEVELFDPTVSSIARGRLELSSRPKPLTAYASISTTLGFVHHDGTDEAKELDVIRYIMARESIILKLQNLCHKIGQCDKLVQSSMLLESELLDTLALMRATTVNFVEVLCSWRESSFVHRALARLFGDRGVELDRTYQLNTGGNTDFLNMLERSRLESKKRSKTEAVQSQLDVRLDPSKIHVGPSDYVAWQGDNKLAFIRMEGRGFGGQPIELELRLSVQDSPNSAGVVIDAVRCAKLALDRGLAGPIESASAYYMKSPPRQLRDEEARRALEEFIA